MSPSAAGWCRMECSSGRVQVLAEYYELIQAIAGPDVQWTVMEPTPVNPTYTDGPAARTLRADSPTGRTAAFVSIFTPPGKRPNIQRLRKRAR